MFLETETNTSTHPTGWNEITGSPFVGSSKSWSRERFNCQTILTFGVCAWYWKHMYFQHFYVKKDIMIYYKTKFLLLIAYGEILCRFPLFWFTYSERETVIYLVSYSIGVYRNCKFTDPRKFTDSGKSFNLWHSLKNRTREQRCNLENSQCFLTVFGR